MDFMFEPDDKLCKIEICNQYLKKIPELYKQIEISEKMYRKARLELEIFDKRLSENDSTKKYKERLYSLMEQSEERHRLLCEELKLIIHLKKQLEE